MKLPFFFSHKQSSPLIINNLLTPSWVLGWGKIDQTKENISGHDPNLIIYHTQPTISTNQKIIIVGDICLTNLPQLQKKLDKLDKHIDFIDKTYDGLKGPISMATKFFGRR